VRHEEIRHSICETADLRSGGCDPVDRGLRVVLEKLAEAADALDRLNTRTEGLLLRIEIVERDMRHARAWVTQEIDTQRRLKQIEEKVGVKWLEG